MEKSRGGTSLETELKGESQGVQLMRFLVTPYSFPGFPAFLEAAAKQIGHPEAEAPARRIATLSSMANLCAQAGSACQEDARTILSKAAEFRDQLHAAHQAAELMLSEVHRALGLNEQTVESATDAFRKKKSPNGRAELPKGDFPS